MKNFELKLPKETKDEYGYTPSENREIEKELTKAPPGKWANFVNDNIKYKKTEKAIAAESQKKHLKELIQFGLENSSEPVIKNPIMRKALEPKPFKISKKIKPITKPVKPVAPIQWDWRLAPWYDHPADDDAPIDEKAKLNLNRKANKGYGLSEDFVVQKLKENLKNF